ncbi:T7SS effector LXG polymorphic toxin [Staphylococcus ratti]|uniref:LXG domain-containing protein n=1 Tax=Staphylococcus ratti TaxID=2892440 RepID=A0ABY3PCH3_9STAP|nr:T7SS effector LXG polymorphic toxin [Staphylococcus ratti]UEX90016.1 LXG domain-containing protein [Staphylococcus ratti]
MSVKVDMREVHNMKDAITKELSKTNSDLESLKGSMSKLIETKQFEGATATNIKDYTNTFHNQTIEKFKNTNQNFVQDISKSINKFSESVDNHEEAILVEDEIEKYKTDIIKKVASMKESVEYANVNIEYAGGLTTAKKISYENLINDKNTFKDYINTTLEKLEDFDALNSIDGDITNNAITELKGLTSYVKKGLPANRSTIKSTSKKIERAILHHKTREELVKFQEFLEKNSDYMNRVPSKSRKAVKAFKQAGRELLALKAIGNGDVIAGYNKFMSVRNVDKLIDSMSHKQLQKMALFMHTDADNIKLKNLLKSSGEFVKNNPFKKGNLVNWMTNVQNYKSKSSELLKNELKDKNFQYKFGDSRKFFDTAEMKKAASTEFKNTFSSQNFRDHILKKENLKFNKTPLTNVKNYLGEGVKGLKGDFSSKNILGKFQLSMKLGGKVLKPLGVAAAITDNLDEKSTQEKLVGMGVDLGAIGASAAAGAAIGTAIPIPVVGTLLGAGAGILVGVAMEAKLPGFDKSATELAKEGINKSIDAQVNTFKSGWNLASKGLKTIFN